MGSDVSVMLGVKKLKNFFTEILRVRPFLLRYSANFFPGTGLVSGIFLVFVWYLGRIHSHHRCPPTARVNERASSALENLMLAS